jgi:hypothetical protein
MADKKEDKLVEELKEVLREDPPDLKSMKEAAKELDKRLPKSGS